jgi:transcriptional regulator with XRE-family HTH domain
VNEESFGQRLRRERERRQIPLASIAANTKISLSLFEGLERDDVSRWPSGIFRRSFIRAYATAIGMDGDELTREFLTLYPDPAETLAADARHSHAPDAARHSAERGLRLTFADTGSFTAGQILAAAGQRLAAVACDLGVIMAVGLCLFIVMDTFWMPLGVSALLYYVGGILVLGNTPGVSLFAPGAKRIKGRRPPRPPIIRNRLETLRQSIQSGLAQTRKSLSGAAKLLPPHITAPRDL